ncbi:MAG TPA: DNA-binding transcriptional regulator [Thermogutta sp.]|nr:DNA-binding transcriptional regulator [Thermogutta sp.]
MRKILRPMTGVNRDDLPGGVLVVIAKVFQGFQVMAYRRDIPRVALLIETSRGYGRQFLKGVIRYGRLHGPWGFYITPGDLEQVLPRMRRWGGTGIIARVETSQAARAIVAAKLPTILVGLSSLRLRRNKSLAQFSQVHSDSYNAGRLAAEHLLERGFRHFAYVGLPGYLWSQRREQGFCDRISEAGFTVDVYPLASNRTGYSRNTWEKEHRRLADWLATLPHPVGLMACNDDRGREVLEACRTAGIRVPEEMAVVGVDNDELFCELSDPPLSSVALNAEAAGYRAAALLDRMMLGEKIAPQEIVAEALHVVTRRSSEIVAMEDPDLTAALQFIHDHVTEPITVADVVSAVHVSRRALELRFRRQLGRTIHEELERLRLQRAERLLIETELPIPYVAEAVGYNSPNYFARIFQQKRLMSPTEFRRQKRGELLRQDLRVWKTMIAE